jgi:hypothetical protein
LEYPKAWAKIRITGTILVLATKEGGKELDSERRRAPRYPIIADAEVIEIASDTELSAKTSDLSAGGCFLDMLNPSPEGTEVLVRITREDSTFTALGRVVFLFPNMGMGVMFTSVDAEQQAVLQKWLEELGRSEG